MWHAAGWEWGWTLSLGVGGKSMMEEKFFQHDCIDSWPYQDRLFQVNLGGKILQLRRFRSSRNPQSGLSFESSTIYSLFPSQRLGISQHWYIQDGDGYWRVPGLEDVPKESGDFSLSCSSILGLALALRCWPNYSFSGAFSFSSSEKIGGGSPPRVHLSVVL